MSPLHFLRVPLCRGGIHPSLKKITTVRETIQGGINASPTVFVCTY